MSIYDDMFEMADDSGKGVKAYPFINELLGHDSVTVESMIKDNSEANTPMMSKSKSMTDQRRDQVISGVPFFTVVSHENKVVNIYINNVCETMYDPYMLNNFIRSINLCSSDVNVNLHIGGLGSLYYLDIEAVINAIEDKENIHVIPGGVCGLSDFILWISQKNPEISLFSAFMIQIDKKFVDSDERLKIILPERLGVAVTRGIITENEKNDLMEGKPVKLQNSLLKKRIDDLRS